MQPLTLESCKCSGCLVGHSIDKRAYSKCLSFGARPSSHLRKLKAAILKITIRNAKKTCKSAFSWAFQIFEMVGRVGFEPKTNWLKEKWHYLTVAMGLSARRMVLRSLKTEWIPTVDYMAAQEAQRGISHDLMHRYNWIRPYQPNDGLPPAQDGKNLNVVSGIRSPLHRGDGPAQLFVR
ncbi:transposase protein orfB [Pseudomonas coronafaciens pv. coronafaciens]|nr:transposase protein orfB [Pseudomonas coronafaciens pv. coronafaciens]